LPARCAGPHEVTSGEKRGGGEESAATWRVGGGHGCGARRDGSRGPRLPRARPSRFAGIYEFDVQCRCVRVREVLSTRRVRRPSEVAGGNGLDVVRATQKKKKKKQRLKGVTSARERAIGKAAKRGGEVLTTRRIYCLLRPFGGFTQFFSFSVSHAQSEATPEALSPRTPCASGGPPRRPLSRSSAGHGSAPAAATAPACTGPRGAMYMHVAGKRSMESALAWIALATGSGG